MDEHRNPELENKAVFTSRSMKFGIPTRVFVAIVVVIAFTSFVSWSYLPKLIGIPVSVILALVIFIPAYLAHKTDPDAYVLWIRSLWADSRLTTLKSTKRRMLVLVPGSGGKYIAQPTSQGNRK